MASQYITYQQRHTLMHIPPAKMNITTMKDIQDWKSNICTGRDDVNSGPF